MSPDAWSAISLSVLGVVFLLTFLNQFEGRRIGQLLERANRFGLWPNWTLFVLPPADLRLWIEEGPGDWRPVDYGVRRRLRQLVWNPEVRRGFWLFYAAREQAGHALQARRSAWGMVSRLQTSTGFKALRNVVASMPAPAAGERRFAIVLGAEPPEDAGRCLIYRSPPISPLPLRDGSDGGGEG
ncbi:MAG: hypothetical protein DWQ36_20225 [Acidobacteria bacterium]|nr:MAG: hypothetical protein DWQ30_10180 [Acidobacteriota bacterium]REK03196.1 MAG: hypothetical protein DWQ36_20225 [Acidobacteriota bacterium]